MVSIRVKRHQMKETTRSGTHITRLEFNRLIHRNAVNTPVIIRNDQVDLNSRVSCQKGPTRHAYAWQIGPFWQDTLELKYLVCDFVRPYDNTFNRRMRLKGYCDILVYHDAIMHFSCI